MADRIQLRRDTKANWEAYNPILLEGEPGHVLDDPNLYKMGDGIHTWNQLPYRGYNGTILQEMQDGVENSVPSSEAILKYFGRYVENSDYLRAYVDADDKFLWGIQKDGNVVYGAGVPKQIKDYISVKITEINGNIDKVFAFLDGYLSDSTLQEELDKKVDKDEDKSLIDKTYAERVQFIDNEEYMQAEIDDEHQLLGGRKKDGTKFENIGFETPKIKIGSTALDVIEDPEERLELTLDKENRIIKYRKKDGTLFEPKFESKSIRSKSVYTDELSLGDKAKETIIETVKGDAEIGNSILPSYYFENNYINNRVLKIQEAIMQMGRGDIFGFLTDTHPMNRANKRDGRIFKFIASQTPLQKILFGGDIGPSDAEHSYGEGVKALEGLARSVMQQTERLYNPCREAGCEIYITRGNHDFACTDNVGATTVGSGYQATMKATRQMLFAYANMSKVVTNEDDDNSLYYYFDNKLQGIRYIIVDTSDSGDSYDPEAMISNVTMRIRDAQIKWIVETAILTTPADYKIVFMGHVMPSDVGYGAPDSNQWRNRTIYNLNHIIQGIQTNSVVTIKLFDNVTDYTCDFTSFTPKVLMYLGGHTHMDCQTYENGCVYYESGADWFTQESVNIARVETQLFGIALPPRAYNTITENLVNVILIDITNEKIKLFRIGTGVDRIFNMHQIQISSGSSTTLTSSLTGTIRWKSYDAKITGPSNNDMFSHTITSVGENTGVVTGLTAGESVVVAYSEEENCFEFFDIKVV